MNKNKLIDISINDNLNTIYNGSIKPETVQQLTIEEDGANLVWMKRDLHYGTHMDSPLHFVKDGGKISEIDTSIFVGECEVIELNSLLYEDIKHIKPKKDVVFIKCNNTLHLNKEFNKDFIGFDLDGSKWITENNIKMIGIDYLSIESYYSNGDAHREILGNNILILEGLDLHKVDTGIYKYYSFPLKLNHEASPVRVMLENI